jgi:methionyl-tRNA formyltransferase
MKIVYFTKGLRGSTCLERILEEKYQVLAVIGVIQEDAIDQLADEYGFPVLLLEEINSLESVARLKKFEADLFILSGYNKILKKEVINIPPLGTINLHGGKLPEYRGAAPINWQIINGETTGGCSIIYVDEGIDTGDIISQEIYPIEPEDTHASVLEKTLDIFPRQLLEVLRDIEKDTVQAQEQDPNTGNYFPRRYPHDSKIDWQGMTDIQVHNLVRGMHGPYPAAFTFRGDEQVDIDKTRILDETIQGIPGRVTKLDQNGVVVLANNRGLRIEKITIHGEQRNPETYFSVGDELD